MQEQGALIAQCAKQRQAHLLLISVDAFGTNMHRQIAKKQAMQQADTFMRRHLLGTMLLGWQTLLQVTSFVKREACV